MDQKHIAETAQAVADKAQTIIAGLDAGSRQQKSIIDLGNCVTSLADCVTHLAGGAPTVETTGQGQPGDDSPTHTHPAAGGEGYGEQDADVPRADEPNIVSVFTDRGGTEWGYVLDAEAYATMPYRKPKDGGWEAVGMSDDLPGGLLEAMGNALPNESSTAPPTRGSITTVSGCPTA